MVRVSYTVDVELTALIAKVVLVSVNKSLVTFITKVEPFTVKP